MRARGGKSSGPKFVTCYLCNQQFGQSSLPIHQQACYKKQYTAWLSRPKSSRLPPPTHPSEVPNYGIDLVQTSHAPRGDGGESVKPQAVVGGLVPCASCGRTFAPDRIDKHEAVCAEGKSKRAVFNARKQRLKGTDAESQRISPSANSPRRHSGGWKSSRQGFLQQIRNAKHSQVPNHGSDIEIFVPNTPPPRSSSSAPDTGRAANTPPRRTSMQSRAPLHVPSSGNPTQRDARHPTTPTSSSRRGSSRSEAESNWAFATSESLVVQDRRSSVPTKASACLTEEPRAPTQASSPAKFATRRGAAPVVSSHSAPSDGPPAQNFAGRSARTHEPERTAYRSSTPRQWSSSRQSASQREESQCNNGGSSRAAHRSASASAKAASGRAYLPERRGSQQGPSASQQRYRVPRPSARNYDEEQDWDVGHHMDHDDDPYTAKLYAEYLSRRDGVQGRPRAVAQPVQRKSARQQQRDAFEYELQLRYELEVNRKADIPKGAWRRDRASERSRSHDWRPSATGDEYDRPSGGPYRDQFANDSRWEDADTGSYSSHGRARTADADYEWSRESYANEDTAWRHNAYR